MFYGLCLLRRQNEGRFIMAWSAATRGIAPAVREFGKKKIHELNTVLLCEEIMEYVQSGSSDPRKRLSLRLTLFLIRGTVLLFQKQVTLFQDTLVEFLTDITAPNRIISPPREAVLSQRNFLTPPTPVIKEKRKKKTAAKKPDENMVLEEFLRLGEEQEGIAQKQPIDEDERRRSLQLLEEHPLLDVGITDDLLGELGVVPMQRDEIQVPQVPEETPSEQGSVKSQLEKIEELLVAEEEQRNASEEIITEARKASKRKKRSSSIDESPKVIQVVAMVHQPAEEEEIGDPIVPPTVIEKIVPTELSEETERITEDPQILEEIQEVVSKKPSTPVKKRTVPARKAVLKQMQQDEIPLPEETIRESEEIKRKKELLIAKNLRIKFRKPKRVLHLDDYDKIYDLEEKFPMNIYEQRILDVDLMDAVMRKFRKVDLMGPPDLVRKEGISLSSDAIRRASKQTPSISKSHDTIVTPQFQPESIKLPVTSDFMVRDGVKMVQSTPLREDIVVPQKKLFEETRVAIEDPIPEQHERKKENFATEYLVQQIESIQGEEMSSRVIRVEDETTREESESYKIIEPSVRKIKLSKEQEARRNIIKQKVKQWDKAQGDLIFDYLIPTPKNRVNAALTFGDLLALAKEGYVNLHSEENSISLKLIERGRLLQ